MPLIEAAGTTVARIRPESVKKSMEPSRSCESMAVSPPSWLLGKTSISTAPLLSALMRSAALVVKMVSGWVTGELFAYFSVNSAPKALETYTSGTTLAAPAAPTNRRLVSFCKVGVSSRL